jgi:hypothetical protein
LFKLSQLATKPVAAYAVARLHDPVHSKLPGMLQPPLLASHSKHMEYVFPPPAPEQLAVHARGIAANDCCLPHASLELNADPFLMAGGSWMAAGCLSCIGVN